MRRQLACLLFAATATAAAVVLPSRTGMAQAQPPHAWLFGAWTGGLFPVSGAITAQACLAQPVVIFTRDVVLEATLTDVTYTQRVIETARTDPGVTEFRFAPLAQAQSQSVFGTTMPQSVGSGFGCEDPNVLHVVRHTDNEIAFPGCANFPNPLVRCPSR